jgi:hypothetical protein
LVLSPKMAVQLDAYTLKIQTVVEIEYMYISFRETVE